MEQVSGSFGAKKPFGKNKAQRISAILVIVGVILLGVILLVISHAQTPYTNSYAANGTITGAACLVSGGSNGNSQAVQFGGNCSGGGNCSSNVPTASSPSFPNYTLSNVVTAAQMNTWESQGSSNFKEDGNGVLAGGGYVSNSHIVFGSNSVVLEASPVSGNPGSTGAGFSLPSDIVASNGGFTFCYSLSSGDWQNVHVGLTSLPVNQVWGDGENDILEGSPDSSDNTSGSANGQLQIDIHEISPANNCAASSCSDQAVLFWPSGAYNTNQHTVTGLWDPTNGYSYYFDGASFTSSVNLSGAYNSDSYDVGSYNANTSTSTTTSGNTFTPSGIGYDGVPSSIANNPLEPTMQIQDTSQNSTSSVTATLYWIASYTYN